MIAVILTIHVIIVLALIGVVLLQRSDGGALGIGGGGGGGFMTGRGAANVLTRTTSILVTLFFATSIGLAIIGGRGEDDETVIEELTGQTAPAIGAGAAGELGVDDMLRALGTDSVEEDAPETGAQDILESLGAAPDEESETPAVDDTLESAPDEAGDEEEPSDEPSNP